MNSAHTHDEWLWGNDSPLTDRLSFTPPPPIVGSALTIAAFDCAEASNGGDAVTWHDWMALLSITAGNLLAAAVDVVPSEKLAVSSKQDLHWYQLRRCGDFALEMSRVLQVDNTYGARLVNWQERTVLQYQATPPSTSVSAWVSDISPISSSMPVMTDEVFADEEGFLMDVDQDDLAAMDEYDRLADQRYAAACAQDARGLAYDRD